MDQDYSNCFRIWIYPVKSVYSIRQCSHSNAKIPKTDNSARREGGGLYCWITKQMVCDSIMWGNTAQYGDTAYLYNWAVLSFEYCDVENGQSSVHTGTSGTLNWGEGMIGENPIFVTGPVGEYYLSQTEAGQQFQSPCADAGSDSSENICFETGSGTVCMDDLTTRTDEHEDTGQVDMGYHYFPSSYATPTPNPTESPTTVPTIPTQTPTPAPTDYAVRLEMPDDYFSPGETCGLNASLINPEQPMQNVPLFVILDILGEYWYWDDWTHDVDFNCVEVPSGQTEITIIEEFIWPDTGDDAMENLMFLGAMTNSEMTEVLSGLEGIGEWTFGFGPE